MSGTFRDTIEDILSKHIKTAVDEAIDAYRTLINAGLGEDIGGRVVSSRSRRSALKGPRAGRKMAVSLKSRPCPYPGCKNPTKGPRFRFFCAEHRELPKAEQDRILAARDAGGDAGPANGQAKPARKAAAKRSARGAAPRKRGRKAGGAKTAASKRASRKAGPAKTPDSEVKAES